jgi:hypothetical protein
MLESAKGKWNLDKRDLSLPERSRLREKELRVWKSVNFMLNEALEFYAKRVSPMNVKHFNPNSQ